MGNFRAQMSDNHYQPYFNWSAGAKVSEQNRARSLLIQSDDELWEPEKIKYPKIEALLEKLSPATSVFKPDEIQQAIFHADTGTHIIPSIFKKMLANIESAFVIRPGSIDDLMAFVSWAYETGANYSIRGAATWPFGGSVPLNEDIILDLAYLDFIDLEESTATLTVGAGVIFPKAKRFLAERGFALRQEISNTGSGTICGWIATGGMGLGSYKYGSVRNSVLDMLVVSPAGEIRIVKSIEQDFDFFFNSEGQFGVIIAVRLRVRNNNYVSKPYALSFQNQSDAAQFMQLISQHNLSPTSVIYFDKFYIRETQLIESQHLEQDSKQALETNDRFRLQEVHEDKNVLKELSAADHILVLEFDDVVDYQRALKSKLFGAGGETRRIHHISFRQLSTELAHLIWEHRFLPVQMKQQGPSMLVSETILPLSVFENYSQFLNKIIGRLLNIQLKTEAHLLPNKEILVQSIFLADTRTLRHKLYFALVPLMSLVAYHFDARPYGIGIWNALSLNRWKKTANDRARDFFQFKQSCDPNLLLNQGKFINSSGMNFFARVLVSIFPKFLSWFIRTYDKRLQGRKFVLSFPLEKIIWQLAKFIFPRVIPPQLKRNGSDAIENIIAACAECDSCERVCPTSDVFGLYGPATPITRRITAQRISRGLQITTDEALGFLSCTRCDRCTDICPTHIPLTELFDLVEKSEAFQTALEKQDNGQQYFLGRFWQIMKESPLYRPHTLADQKDSRSHLEHGLAIHYDRGFEYSRLFIDTKTCIHCGMCSNENACIYGARTGLPRQIPELIDINCALCNACVNFCPQNKLAQQQRLYLDKLIENAVDLEEKKYWMRRQQRIHDTTKVIRSEMITEMSDKYVSEEIIMEIDKEASTGKIPVSGSGQGDRHMGIGFDAERFAHFHIVGPAQNRLHEGDPDEELSVTLGKREDFCKFDRQGNLVNPVHPTIKLMSPILYNAVQLESNGKVELAFIKTAEHQKSLVVISLDRLLEHYQFILQEGGYTSLPEVIVPRVDHELINQLIVSPKTNREFLSDLWRMPVFEIEYHPEIERTLNYIKQSAASLGKDQPLICGYLEISEHDLIGSLTLVSQVKQKINQFLDHGVDLLHVHGSRNREMYFVTSRAVRALHHYLMRIGRRHELSILASGGIRLASDTQKTIQRGAEATLIDFSALLALDPTAYRAIIENKTTTEKLLSLDVDWAVKRLNNQAESRKVQILEVLGASGFKDIKKTVGEEGRLIDFHKIENRIQRTIFENKALIQAYDELNQNLIESEPIPPDHIRTYRQLKQRILPVTVPHQFYRLGDTNQKLFGRDFVWPGELIKSMGKMAAGDPAMLLLENVPGAGLLGDGFDVMQILFNKNPIDVDESELEKVQTALPLDKNLTLEAPWMFGGKSVGSIGLDTWKAHVTAARDLGIQYDTGEGGYPSCFFLNSKGEPIFFTENEIQLIKPFFVTGKQYTAKEMVDILKQNAINQQTNPELFKKINQHPSLKLFQFVVVVEEEDEPFVSTELKTGLFGVNKTTIKKARRVVIAYSQGAKMGIGGHILAQKVNKLVSYMRGVEGLELLNRDKIEKLYLMLKKLSRKQDHPLAPLAGSHLSRFDQLDDLNNVTDEIKNALREIQEVVYQLKTERRIDPIDFENLIRLCEEIIEYSYSSIISPFPFHNCYSIEDVKAFIDVVRMINPECVISIKVSPSIDIEFIATGLARIAKDNTEEILKTRFPDWQPGQKLSAEMKDYVQKYGMKIEIWLDGPRGGTGASPNIIKGQMGMHLEYAIPLIHNRLVQDRLRNWVKFIVSGGMRTYEDVIKAVALGADGVIWGTAPLVAIGCDRNRNCHDGCSRGIATSNLALQKLRDVAVNTRQIINAFTMIQMQVIRCLAALGFTDIRQLRGRFDKIHWIGLKERVDHRYRVRQEMIREIERDEKLFEERLARAAGQSNCGVAAVNANVSIPGNILDETLRSMQNRGMDGVGIAKTLCFPEHPNEYAYRVMVKGILQRELEEKLNDAADKKRFARKKALDFRIRLMNIIKRVFLDPCFNYYGEAEPENCREHYKLDADGNELDYREFGDENTDPGDIFKFFVRVKQNVLFEFIENKLLHRGRPGFLGHLFPGITIENYKQNQLFLHKAEDLFVLNHSHDLTRILYVSSALPEELENYAGKKINISRVGEEFLFYEAEPTELLEYLSLLRDFMQDHAYEHHKHRYGLRVHKIAAVMSCGKNFAIWKTAGRRIPWQTPDAPNNIIHIRLATGSAVEQMNAHPFSKLHTALTHNGETTNYEALRQRVEQFNLSPLASTDTEVASLKFHLVADEWEYPDWALFESFSPTTGDDLKLVDPEIRAQLEQVQRVEFASSPDGPYQYLCLRHNPYRKATERVDLKDPADLRPNISALWCDANKSESRFVSIIASEEHAVRKMLELLDREKIIDGAEADQTFVNSGMISRCYFDDTCQINKFELIDRYGKPVQLENSGEHYSVRRKILSQAIDESGYQGWDENYQRFFSENLKKLSFVEFRGLLENRVNAAASDLEFSRILELLSWLNDYLKTLDPGTKALSSLLDIVKLNIDRLLDRAGEEIFTNYFRIDQNAAYSFDRSPENGDSLVIDASGFLQEGTDPGLSLASFLSFAYNHGWRNFIIYRASGHRLISTAVMGSGDTDDVQMDVYGAVGEYFGAFMKGGVIRLHGNAQNFCCMCMHHGELYVFGHAGKVCGYASKGGKVFIMGNVVDRCWTNSVNDSRCQDLEVMILGSPNKYAGESLMGGRFFFAGLHFDQKGRLWLNQRPCLGSKMFGGASRAEFVFFDPEDRLIHAQYNHGKLIPFTDEQWQIFDKKIRETFSLSNIQLIKQGGAEFLELNGKEIEYCKENFKLIVPRGGLKGYESH